MTKKQSSKYAESGVDIDKGNEFVSRIKPIVSSTFKRGVLTGIGGFGGLFALGNKYKDPVLVSATDGVGTKLKIANLCNKHDTVGIDLVAMCVNDLVVCGARPLFFLDYFSVGKLDLEVASEVVKGIAKGCEISDCSLIGGETAEMPGMYSEGEYDVAGFAVGVVERKKIIDGSTIKPGDQLIGLSSSGLHSNGFSLVRKICFEEMGLSVTDTVDALGCSLGEELIRPTRIYVQPLMNVMSNFKVKGLVHITGGGFYDNIPRVLPKETKAIITNTTWQVPPVFDFLRTNGNVSAEEMLRTFNCGIGMVLVVRSKDTEDVLRQIKALGEGAYHLGEVAARKGSDDSEVEIDCEAVFG